MMACLRSCVCPREDVCLRACVRLVPPAASRVPRPVCSQWVFDYLSPTDKTLVMQAEMIAPIAALLSRPDDFAGRSVVLFIDNVGALSSLLHGYSSKPDCARLCNVFHLLAASLRCSFWFEWVPSGANISDLPSRLYYERYLQLLPRSRWFSCTLPDASTWDAPLRAVLRSFRALAPAL
jgi:hypothetical protein